MRINIKETSLFELCGVRKTAGLMVCYIHPVLTLLSTSCVELSTQFRTTNSKTNVVYVNKKEIAVRRGRTSIPVCFCNRINARRIYSNVNFPAL